MAEDNKIDWEGMDKSQQEFDKRQSERLVADMSLSTMFPDKKLRSLASAAGKGKLDEIDKIIKSGVDVNAQGTSGATALYWAYRESSYAGAQKLLELGANPNVIFGDNSTVMH